MGVLIKEIKLCKQNSRLSELSHQKKLRRIT